MRTIRLSSRAKPIGTGGTGSYYRVNRFQGVKIYDNSHSFYKKDVDFRDAKRDAALMRRVACPLVPKLYEVSLVHIGAEYYAGILMEHIEGRTLHEIHRRKSNDQKAGDISDNLAIQLNKLTNHHFGDLHSYNIIFCKKTRRYRAIDIETYWIAENNEEE